MARPRPDRLAAPPRRCARPALAVGLWIAAIGVPAGAAPAAQLDVGPQQALKMPSAAAAIAKDGDTVAIDPGEYFDCAVWSASHLTIAGTSTAGAVVITDKTCQGKALFVIDGSDITIRNITFTRARVADGNGAGIRAQGADLTVEDSRFINNESGILASDNPGSVIAITNTEFRDDGACESGCAHALLVGRIRLLRVAGSRFFATRLAHHISSGALRTELFDNDIEDGPDGTSSYLVDVPNGGSLVLDHNVLEKGPRTSNPQAAIMIGDGGAQQPTGEIVVTRNRFTNDTGHQVAFVLNWGDADPVLDNNVFVGAVTPVSTRGAWVHRARVDASAVRSALHMVAAGVVHLIRPLLARLGLHPI